MIDRQGRTPLYRQIAGELRAQIDAGDYGPGARLPSESAIMAAYGVARLTARHAYRALAAEGVVEVVSGRGAYVAEAA